MPAIPRGCYREVPLEEDKSFGQFTYVTDRQVIREHGSEAFRRFWRWMEGKTLKRVYGDLAFHVSDYEEWVRVGMPDRARRR